MGKKSFEQLNSSQKEKYIPRLEEDVEVSKKKVDDGKVIVTKKVVEHDETLKVDLQSEKVVIERFAKNEILDETPKVRTEGSKTIIPVVKEVLVKKILLIEEVHLQKKLEEHTKAVKEKLKEEHINVQRDTKNPGHKTSK